MKRIMRLGNHEVAVTERLPTPRIEVRGRRFDRLNVQPDLFGQWCVIREWGRIGRAGQVREVPFATAADALEALAQQQRMKERRGYGVP
jgi:predicted DNA-binding WGR domain protein